MSEGSCCPPNSEGYLAPNYAVTGSIVELQNDCQAYVTNNLSSHQGKGIIISPDVFGWNGGRVRAIADELAITHNCVVIVPRLLVNPLHNNPQNYGVDKDGLNESFPWNHFKEYVQSNTWSDVIRPRYIECISFLKQHNINSFGSIGFCWGGHNVFHALIDPSTAEISFGISPHPSITRICEFMEEDMLVLASQIRGPFCLLPASNDPNDYRVGGGLYQAMKAKHDDTEVQDDFNDVVHGFLSRGNIEDEVVKSKILLAMTHINKFISSQFSKLN